MLAVLVGGDLFLFQGVGGLGVALFVQLFFSTPPSTSISLAISSAERCFSSVGLGLFQGQRLGVAVLRGLGLLDGIAVVTALFFLVLPGFGVHAVPGQLRAVLAQLLIQVDLALLRVLFLIAGLLVVRPVSAFASPEALVGGGLGGGWWVVLPSVWVVVLPISTSVLGSTGSTVSVLVASPILPVLPDSSSFLLVSMTAPFGDGGVGVLWGPAGGPCSRSLHP